MYKSMLMPSELCVPAAWLAILRKKDSCLRGGMHMCIRSVRALPGTSYSLAHTTLNHFIFTLPSSYCYRARFRHGDGRFGKGKSINASVSLHLRYCIINVS